MPDTNHANDDPQDNEDNQMMPPAIDKEAPLEAKMTEVEMVDIVHGLAQRLHPGSRCI